MKTIYAFIACAFLSVMLANAQVCPAPEPIDQQAAVGVWHGHYTENGAIRNLRIELKEISGRLVSFVDMPDRGLRSSRFETSICPSMELHIKKTSVDNVTLQFIGKPQGNKMSGCFRIGDSCSTTAAAFSLVKTANALSLK